MLLASRIVQGNFFGMGYLPKDLTDISHKAIAEYVQPYKENSFIRNLLNSFYNNFPGQVKMLNDLS